MKTLLLASNAYTVIDAIQPYLPANRKKLTAAFIATAANLESEKSWLDLDRKGLTSLGCEVFDYDLVRKTYQDLLTDLGKVDILFVSGGNTYFLLEQVRKSGFDRYAKEAVDQGVMYIGSSAGALLACPTIDIARGYDDASVVPELTKYDGLQLIDLVLFLHYDYKNYHNLHTKTLEVWSKKPYTILTLNDAQGLFVHGNMWKVVEGR